MEWIEVFEAKLAGGGTQFLPTPCLQCQNPPCVNVCPVAATFSTSEGVVLIDEQRCIVAGEPALRAEAAPVGFKLRSVREHLDEVIRMVNDDRY